MKPLVVTASALIGIAAVVGVLAVRRAPSAEAEGRQGGKRTPVIVELFTSEGCSSCPSADKLLGKIAASQPIPGAEVIALEEHVDYWNRLGWTDPFSSHAFTSRQEEYARALRAELLYTPQMVVDGQAEFVGSEEDKARAEITRAARAPKALVTVQVAASNKEMKPNTLPLQIRVENLPSGRSVDADVLLAIAENNLRTDVKSGENSGSRLEHTGVVRRLEKIGSISSRAAFTAGPTITLHPGWKRKDLKVVVIVQDRSSHQITGAGVLDL